MQTPMTGDAYGDAAKVELRDGKNPQLAKP